MIIKLETNTKTWIRGFGGIEVLRQLQKAFQDDVSVDITLVSRDSQGRILRILILER